MKGLLRLIWAYFGRSQPVFIRLLHIMILLLVVFQLISSNGVDLDHIRFTGNSVFFDFGTWTHILPGLALVVICAVFVLSEWHRRGLKYFFPYLWADLSQLKTDLKTLFSGKLPASASGGLPAVVQGLGLGALALTLLSGLSWFLLARAGSELAHIAIEAHEVLTNLVIVYLIGHGSMGLLHMILWMRSAPEEG
jgi:hypothetical protein